MFSSPWLKIRRSRLFYELRPWPSSPRDRIRPRAVPWSGTISEWREQWERISGNAGRGGYGRGGTGRWQRRWRRQLPPGVANAVNQGMGEGGFAQTDLTGEAGTNGQSEETVGQANAEPQPTVALSSGNGVSSSSDSFLLQGTTGQGLVASGPNGFGGPGGEFGAGGLVPGAPGGLGGLGPGGGGQGGGPGGFGGGPAEAGPGDLPVEGSSRRRRRSRRRWSWWRRWRRRPRRRQIRSAIGQPASLQSIQSLHEFGI